MKEFSRRISLGFMLILLLLGRADAGDLIGSRTPETRWALTSDSGYTSLASGMYSTTVIRFTPLTWSFGAPFLSTGNEYVGGDPSYLYLGGGSRFWLSETWEVRPEARIRAFYRSAGSVGEFRLTAYWSFFVDRGWLFLDMATRLRTNSARAWAFEVWADPRLGHRWGISSRWKFDLFLQPRVALDTSLESRTNRVELGTGVRFIGPLGRSEIETGLQFVTGGTLGYAQGNGQDLAPAGVVVFFKLERPLGQAD